MPSHPRRPRLRQLATAIGLTAMWCFSLARESLAGTVYTELASIQDANLPWTAWAPNALRFAYTKDDGLYVAEITNGMLSTSHILSSRVTDIAWSNDGNWIACRTQDSSQVIRGTANLVLCSRTPPEAYQILRETDVGNICWTSAGTLAATHTTVRTKVSALIPPSGRATRATPNLPSMITSVDSRAGTLGIQLVSAGGAPIGTIVSSRTLGWSRNAHFIVRDRFPDGARYLVQIVGARGPSVVMSTDGQILDTLAIMGSPDEMRVTSISGDGNCAIGYGYHTDPAHPGEELGDLTLVSVSTKTRYPLQGITNGTAPQLSKIGMRLIYLDNTNSIHVGEVTFQ